jgi:hypothetical protein
VKIVTGSRGASIAGGGRTERRASGRKSASGKQLRVHRAAAALTLSLAALASGCAVVPQNRRSRLADPMMSVSDPRLEAYRKEKFYTSREGAAGGEGAAAGGGCGCQ